MGFLDFMFKGKKDLKKNNTNNLINLFTPFFSGDDSFEYNSTYMSICGTHANHISKMQPMIYLKDTVSKSHKYIARLLTLRPNPYMNAPTFWETVGRNYYMYNNAFIFLEWNHLDFKEPLKALWILDPDKNSIELKSNESNELFMSFRLNGQQRYTSIDNIAVISRNVDPNNFFGKSNEAIRQVLKVLKTNYEGIEQAVRTSAFIRFIVTTTTPLSDKAKEERANYFKNTYLGKDASGAVYVEQASQLQQVTTSPKIIDAEQMNLLKKDVYEYLNCNEKITTGAFNEDEWQAYYESAIEPYVIKVATELTSKIFSIQEQTRGYHIFINADRLQTASLKTRVQVAAMYQKLPVYIPNVVARLLFLPESENGDKEFSNLNYVQTEKQNEYQLEQDGKEEEKEEDKNATNATNN